MWYSKSPLSHAHVVIPFTARLLKYFMKIRAMPQRISDTKQAILSRITISTVRNSDFKTLAKKSQTKYMLLWKEKMCNLLYFCVHTLHTILGCHLVLSFFSMYSLCGMIHLYWPPTNSGTWFRGCLRIRSSCLRTHTDSWTHSHTQSPQPGHSAPSLQHSGADFNCTVRQRETWGWTGGSDIIHSDGHHLSGRHTSWWDRGWAAWGLDESSWG